MLSPARKKFRRQFIPMIGVSVVDWFLFALLFKGFWHGPHEPGDSLTAFWTWLVAGVAFFAVAVFGLLRWFRVPPASRAAATIALTAPALCCDIFTTVFFEHWFPHGGSADDRFYAALVLGGVGLIQMLVLWVTAPEESKLLD